jgi:hypothetical protein
MIAFINQLLIKCGSNYVVAPLEDTLALIIRCDAYAKYITSTLEDGHVAFYNEKTHQVEVGVKH